MFKISLFVLVCFMFISCSNVTSLRTSDNSSAYTESNPDQIEVFSTSKIGKQYEIIGEVMANADAGENSEKPVILLKKQASRLGADAIINLRLSFSYGYWSTGIIAVGTAVKFK